MNEQQNKADKGTFEIAKRDYANNYCLYVVPIQKFKLIRKNLF